MTAEDAVIEAGIVKSENGTDPEFSLKDAELEDGKPKAKRKPRAKKPKVKKEDVEEGAEVVKAEDGTVPEVATPKKERKSRKQVDPNAFSKTFLLPLYYMGVM